MYRFQRALVILGMVLLVSLLVACERESAQATPTAAPGAPAPAGPITGIQPSGPFATGGVAQGAPTLIANASQQTGIWVLGTGKVVVQPQLAVFTLGVESRAATVEEARGRAAEAMNSIVKSLKANGVADRDIQTRLFTITPQYVYRERTDQGGRFSEQVLVGYTVSNQATVRVRDLGKVGVVIDDVARAGGDLTRIQGISFTVEDFSPYQIQARELAVKNALAKAGQFASLTGVTLGRLVYITESSATPVVREFAVREAVAAAPGAPTPVSPGELEVQVNVQAAFAIQ